MRIGISSGLLRRLSKVEARRTMTRSIGLWPAIMDADEWSATAMSMQARLMSDTAWEPNAPPPPAPVLDLSNVSHRYRRPGAIPRRGQTVEERRWLGEQTPAQDEYEEAYRRGERRPDLIANR